MLKLLKQISLRSKLLGVILFFTGVAITYVLFLLTSIIRTIDTSDTTSNLDNRVADILFFSRNTQLIEFFSSITVLGNWQTIIVLSLLILVYFWIFKKKKYILPFLVTIIGSEVANFTAKLIFHRPRPSLAFYKESFFSFPSGHSTIAISFYGFIVYLIWRGTSNSKYRFSAIVLGILVALGIGISRIYLEVHFLSDVIAGYLLGFLWLGIGIAISEWLIAQQKEQRFPAVAFSKVLGYFSDETLPHYTEKIVGGKGEPLSFIIACLNDNRLIQTFQKTRWYLADPINIFSTIKIIKAVIFNKSYPAAPVTPCFWNNKKQDFSFEKPTLTNSPRQRHHCRIWKTPLKTLDGKKVYIGTASFDIGLKWLGLIHKIDPRIDRERELIFSDLKNSIPSNKFYKESFVGPVHGRNNFGDEFLTDGKIYIIDLDR